MFLALFLTLFLLKVNPMWFALLFISFPFLFIIFLLIKDLFKKGGYRRARDPYDREEQWRRFVESAQASRSAANVTRPTVRPVENPPNVDREGQELLSHWTRTSKVKLQQSKNILQLVGETPELEIGYNSLLSCVEWQLKRMEILYRDSYTCQDCRTRTVHLHVHHTYYLKDRLPWDIEDRALVSLCGPCHRNRHNSAAIPVYLKLSNGTMVPTENRNIYCSRCNGAGHFPQFQHVQEGICFRCNGNKLDRSIFSVALSAVRSFPTNYSYDLKINQFFSTISVDSFMSRVITEEPRIDNGDVSDDLPF